MDNDECDLCDLDCDTIDCPYTVIVDKDYKYYEVDEDNS